MEGSAKQKVPGGKLLSIKVKYGKKVEKIEILGDFFLYPEEALSEIEKSLTGIDTNLAENEITIMVQSVVDKEGAELVGITPEAIASTLRSAIKNGMESNSA